MIRRVARRAARVPGLQEWACGAQQDERQSNRERKQAKNAPSGIDLRMRTPKHLRPDGQPQEADEKKAQVNHGLESWREAARSYVGIEIAEKQRALKKNQTRSPNGRRSPEPRKD